jgi:membrane protein implicated in regulation of membrane protease activity
LKTPAKIVLAGALILGVMNPAVAYVGPGAGLSLLTALWGLLAAVFAALSFVILWPLRRMWKGRREKATPAHIQAQSDQASSPSADSQSHTAGRSSV